MDAKARTPTTRRELAESIAAEGDLRRRLAAHARLRFRLPASAAEDLVQDVCLELMRRDGPVRDPEALAFRILRYECLHLLRSARWRREVSEEEVSGLADRTSAPGASIELLALVRQAVAGVSPACRRLLHSHYVEGRSLKETANALSYASPNNVWALLARCVQRLRAALGVNR